MSKKIGIIFCKAQALITLIWTFLGIRIYSPGFAMAIIPDWIKPDAPFTPKKHFFVFNFFEIDICASCINPLLDRGEPISGSSGKSQKPGCFFNNLIKPFGKAFPLLWAGKKVILKTF